MKAPERAKGALDSRLSISISRYIRETKAQDTGGHLGIRQQLPADEPKKKTPEAGEASGNRRKYTIVSKLVAVARPGYLAEYPSASQALKDGAAAVLA